jgi:hypothetical protein
MLTYLDNITEYMNSCLFMKGTKPSEVVGDNKKSTKMVEAGKVDEE